jgi:uncharacterized protein (TIGR00255 family)
MTVVVQSMTGFGAADGLIAGQRFTVEVRSVNHRFFTPSLKVPSALAKLEGDVREAMRQRVARGHVTLSIRRDREGGDAARIDIAKLRAYAEQLRALPHDLGIAPVADLATLLRLPDVVVSSALDEDGSLANVSAADVLPLVQRALDGLVTMRTDEGARLATYLHERLALIDASLARIAARAPARLDEHRERLRANVRELAGGVALDPQRLAQEVAVIADRLDIGEELSRFASHNTAFRAALGEPSKEPVGKRLGFLLQEMVREANTTGSKGNDALIQQEAVAIKEELERMREQVENLE